MVLQQKMSHITCYRHADEVWSIQSILPIHQQGRQMILSLGGLSDWEASGAAFAQFMMGITRGYPVPVEHVTEHKRS